MSFVFGVRNHVTRWTWEGRIRCQGWEEAETASLGNYWKRRASVETEMQKESLVWAF